MYNFPDCPDISVIIYDWKFLVFYIVISRNFLYDGGAFEHIFCPGGREFEKPDFKKFKFPVSAQGGDVEVSN